MTAHHPAEYLDASALLALIQDEPGAEVAHASMRRGARICAVNFSEVVSKLVSWGVPAEDALKAAALPELEITPIDDALATAAGIRHGSLRRNGLSLADSFCLAAAHSAGVPVVTADRAWGALDLDVTVRLIR